MPVMIFSCIVFVISFNISHSLHAQQETTAKWRHYLSAQAENKELSADENIICLVRFNDKQTIRDSRLHGIQVLRVLDREHAIAAVPAGSYVRLKNQGVIVGKANHLWKLSDNLLKTRDEEMCTVMVKTSRSEQLMNTIQKEDRLEILDSQYNLFIVRGKMSHIKTLLSNPYVDYVGLESLKVKQESQIYDQDFSVNRINRIHHHMPAINGYGTTVSIKDDLFDTGDLDLLGKNVHSTLSSDITNAHATDMATIIAGAGNSSIQGKGVAYQGRVTSSDDHHLLPDPYEILAGLGVNVQNHSYGTVIENFYGALAEAYDEITHSHPTIVHNFSSGNSGELIPQDGNYAGTGTFANLTGNYKMAKNILTVGAVGPQGETLPFSSRGPAFDGRIKPELVAYSTLGTSNSTALVSGLSTLLQQQFRDMYNSIPPSSLIRASLINAAHDIGAPGPDFVTGFGNVDGYESLLTIKEGRFFVDQVSQDETKIFSIDIPANTCNLKVSLVWTDVPALANSNIALVNDLDMQIKDSQGNTWLPWVPDTSASVESLTSLATRGADHLNTIEQVTLDTLPPGNYTIEIKGFNVTSSGQEFAIAYQWSLADQFEWHYPTGSDPVSLEGEMQVLLKWMSTYDTASGTLQVSYDEGITWQTIDTHVNLSKRFYVWVPDSGSHGTAILKMKINDSEYLSGPFIMAYTTRVKVGLNCDEAIELRWNENPDVRAYNIYHLQGVSMQVIAQTTDHTYAFKRSDYNTPYFAVQPVFDNERAGERSQVIDLESYSSGCYVSSFYAIGSPEEETIVLHLVLGSLYRVKYIEIYRVGNEEMNLIKTLYQPDELTHVLVDSNPVQGKNEYRAKIVLSSGKEYLSEVADAFFLTEKPYFLFPNPVNTDEINIYTKNFEGHSVFFKLFSIEGKPIFTRELTADRSVVPLNGLAKGVYLYSLESSNGVKESGVLVIQ